MNNHKDNSEWLSRLLHKTQNRIIKRFSFWGILSTAPSVRFYATFMWVLILVIVGLEALAHLGVIPLMLLPSDVILWMYKALRSIL